MDNKDIINILRESKISIEKREAIIRELLYNHPFWRQSAKSKGRKFFRAQSGIHYTVDRLWAPPSSYVKSSGRANYIGESILYCTDDDIYSCILEIVKRDSNEVNDITIMEYECIEDFDIIPIGLTETTEYSKIVANSISTKDQKKFEIVNNFIQSEFRKNNKNDSSNYCNSSVISKLIREEFTHVLGLRFKTVQDFNFSHYGLNYALDPEKCKKIFKPKHAIHWKYTWNENAQYQIKQIESRIGRINDDKTITYNEVKTQ